MARYICPCCGQAFNGKKCRSCYYETFDDEITRSLHSHQEVNTPDIPLSRPPQVQQEWERQKREFRRKQQLRRNPRQKMPKWLIWLLVIFLAEPVLLIIGGVIDEVFGDFPASFVTREPAPEPDAVLPEGAERLLSADGFQVYLGRSEDGQNYPLFLENTTDQDVHLSSRSIIIDGFLSERSSAWCDAPAGTTRAGELRLDAGDMALAVMDKPGQMELSFVIYDSDSYEDIVEAGAAIDLGGTPVPVAPAGEVLLDTQELLVTYLGYEPDEYDPEVFYEGTMAFYIENKTDRTLSVYTEDTTLNGEEVFLSIWTELPPGTRTVTRMWLYAAEDLGMKTRDQAGDLELHLAAYDEAAENGSLDFGWVTVTP